MLLIFDAKALIFGTLMRYNSTQIISGQGFFAHTNGATTQIFVGFKQYKEICFVATWLPLLGHV